MKHVNEILVDTAGVAIGKGFNMIDLRDKINEIVDYINAKEGVQEESEDDRIRKGLVDFLWCIANGGMNNRGTMPSAEKCQEWLAWLEKHKEKSEELVKRVEEHCAECEKFAEELEKTREKWYGQKRPEQKPAEKSEIPTNPEWSEEDELKLRLCVESLSVPQTKRHIYEYGVTPDELCNWLKSLRPQEKTKTPMWKKIKEGEHLPCRAYLWKLAYDDEMNYHGRCHIDGILVPNEAVGVGCDTWYLPVEDIKNLPKEE